MRRDILDAIVENAGPVVVMALAAVAGIAVFAPLLIAFVAPLLG